VEADGDGEDGGDEPGALGGRERGSDPLGGDGEHGRLGEAGGVDAASGDEVAGFPDEGFQVVGELASVNHVRHHAVLPLAAGEIAEFDGGAVRVDGGEADGNKAGVPEPLVGVDAGRRAGPAAQIVGGQDGGGAGFELVGGEFGAHGFKRSGSVSGLPSDT
jgi:hypothetical protein